MSGASAALAQVAPAVPSAPLSASGAHRVESAPAATYRSGADLVALTVTVTGAAKGPALSSENFAVFEEGVEQPLSFFAALNVPLDLTLLVDASTSMADGMEFVRTAAAHLVGALRAGDRASLATFREALRIDQPLTDDLTRVQAAISQLAPGGGTALYNALYTALTSLQREARTSEIRRRALVILSDGADTASLVSFDDVLDLARRSGVMVYTIAVKRTRPSAAGSNRPDYSPHSYELRALATETGAWAWVVRDPREVNAICGAISEELGRQYALGYVPDARTPAGQWRRVAVRLVGRDGLTPRTRAGYYATDPRLDAIARR